MLNQTVFCMGLTFTDLLKKFSSPPRPPIEGRAGPPRCTSVDGVWKPIAVAAKSSVFQAWRWMLSDVVHRVYTALSVLHKNVVKLFVFHSASHRVISAGFDTLNHLSKSKWTEISNNFYCQAVGLEADFCLQNQIKSTSIHRWKVYDSQISRWRWHPPGACHRGGPALVEGVRMANIEVEVASTRCVPPRCPSSTTRHDWAPQARKLILGVFLLLFSNWDFLPIDDPAKSRLLFWEILGRCERIWWVLEEYRLLLFRFRILIKPVLFQRNLVDRIWYYFLGSTQKVLPWILGGFYSGNL